MPNILKPKRGKKSTAIAQNILLQKGEFFLEMPEEGVGNGAGSIKVGNGVALYRDLPYFFDKEAVAPKSHTHEMDDIDNLNSTISNIEGDISDIRLGSVSVGKSADSDKLGGKPATDYIDLNSSQSLRNKTYEGYTLKAAAGKDVDEEVLVTNSSKLPTSKAVSAYVTTLMGQIVQINYVVLEELPASGVVGTIYLIPHSHGTNDIYDEFLWVDNSRFEKIGNTDIDLSGYASKDHNHSYNDLLDRPTIPKADNDTILQSEDGTLSGSRIRVLEADPINPRVGDMWVLAL